MMKDTVRNLIEHDIEQELLSLNDDISSYFPANYNINEVKKILKRQLPMMLESKTHILHDTLINYLMTESGKIVKQAGSEFINDFYENNLRLKMKEDNDFVSLPLSFSRDPRLLYGGLTFLVFIIAGLLASPLIPGDTVSDVIWAFIAASSFGIFSYIIFTQNSREVVRKDLQKYMNEAKRQIRSELENSMTMFLNEFSGLCNKHNFPFLE